MIALFSFITHWMFRTAIVKTAIEWPKVNLLLYQSTKVDMYLCEKFTHYYKSSSMCLWYNQDYMWQYLTVISGLIMWRNNINESSSLKLSTAVLSPEWHMVPRVQVHHVQYSTEDQTAQCNGIEHRCFSPALSSLLRFRFCRETAAYV